MNRDKSGELGAFLFSRRIPDFCDGQWSFSTNENSNLYRLGLWLLSAMDLAHYQSPKLLGSSPPIKNNRENLGQTSCEYPIYRQNLGWSAKGKIPDHLGFSRHMKTWLYCKCFAMIFFKTTKFALSILDFHTFTYPYCWTHTEIFCFFLSKGLLEPKFYDSLESKIVNSICYFKPGFHMIVPTVPVVSKNV